MLTAIIPTLNAGEHLGGVLSQLRARGVSVVVSDGGSADNTLLLAARHKASIAVGGKGRGAQLSRGAAWANKIGQLENDLDDNFDSHDHWYLFLHADSRLGEGWDMAATLHMNSHADSAAYFRFRAEDKGWKPRLMEFCVRFRELTFGGPYGDQGLLISRALYEQIGGYEDVPLCEDVKIIDALTQRKALRRLPANLYTCVDAYKRGGYWARTKRNLGLYRAFRRGEDLNLLLSEYEKP